MTASRPANVMPANGFGLPCLVFSSPANNGGTENITVNFTSSEFPIFVEFNVTDTAGNVDDSQGPTLVPNVSELPIDYEIPSTLSNGFYNLTMFVTDGANVNVTLLGNFTVSNPIPPASGGGGGGGRPSAAIIRTISISSQQLAIGSTQTLSAGDRIQFVIDGVAHSATLVSIVGNVATIRISSDPYNVFVTIGQSIDVDVDLDGDLDITITFGAKISDTQGAFIIRTYSPEAPPVIPPIIPTEPEPEDPKKIAGLVSIKVLIISILTVVALILVFALILVSRKGRVSKKEVSQILSLVGEGRTSLHKGEIERASGNYKKIKELFKGIPEGKKKEGVKGIVFGFYEEIKSRVSPKKKRKVKKKSVKK